jgi:hypothetical protein
VDWLTGYAAIYNENSQLVRCWLPYRYRRKLFDCAAYGTLLPFLQQESTVWRRSLHANVDFGFLVKLRYAGDAYLWKCFASAAELRVVRGLIGGFRVHRGQISEDIDGYRRELESLCRAPSFGERLQAMADRVMWNMPERVKALAGDATLIVFDHASQSWQRVSYAQARRYR